MFKRIVVCCLAFLMTGTLSAYQIKQSTTAQPLVFFMVDSSDHISGKTGLNPTVTIRKSNASAAGSFATPGGTVRELASGWYQVDGNATDTGTLGPLILHATGTGADPTDIVFEIVAFDPQSSTVAVGSVGSGAITASSFASGAIDAAAIATDAIGSAELASTAVTEISAADADAVWDELRSDHTGALTFGGGVASVQGSVTGAVGSVTDKTGYRLSSTGVDDIWDEIQSGHTTAGSFGKYLDIQSSTISTAGLTNSSIAQAVWDLATSGHTTSGTFGAQAKTVVDSTNTAVTSTGVALADSSITAAKIASNAITSAKIATDAIGASQIAADAIGASEIAADAIGSSEIAASAIGSSEIAAAALPASKFDTDYWTKVEDYAGVIAVGTVSSVTSQTEIGVSFTGQAGSQVAANQVAAIFDTSESADLPAVTTVSYFESDSDTLFLRAAPSATIAVGDKIRIYPAHTGISAIETKLPSKSKLTGTANSDGDIQLDEATGALPANSITATTLAANTITSAKIATDAIGASQIAADAIGASEIAADAIGASEIAANAIGAAEVADGAIDANTFAANAITSTAVADSTITANKIASNAITSAKVANNTIGANQIASGAIDASKISVLGELKMASMGYGSISGVSTTTLQVSNDSTSPSLMISGVTDSLKGMLAVAYDANDLGGVEVRQITTNDENDITVNTAFSSQINAGDIMFVMPGSVTEAAILAKLPSKAYLAGTSNSDGDIQLDEATGALPANSITATTLAANTITSAKIATDAIGASQIAADAIGASEIAADAIGASEIATDAIGASEIAANAIGSSELAAGAITNTKFGSGAIDATAIAPAAITTVKFASGAIDSTVLATNAIGPSQIASNTITSGKIASGAITAASIASDAITSTKIADGTITAAKLADSSITAAKLATGCLTSDEVSSSFLQSYFLVSSGSTYAGSVAGSVVKESGGAAASALSGATFEFTSDSVSQIAAGVWDLSTSGHVGAGSFGAQAKTALDTVSSTVTSSGVVLANNAISSGKIAAGAITSSTFASGAIDAAAIATDAIGANEIAADAIGSSELASSAGTEIAGLTWDVSTTGHTTSGSFGEQAKTTLDSTNTKVGTLYTDWINGGRLDNLLDAVATQSSVTTIGNNVSSILTIDNKLNTALELDGSVYRFTTNALEQAPSVTASAIADAVWDEVQSGHTTSGTFGKYLDAQVTTGALGGVGAVADAVWDEALAGHTTSGTFGSGVKLQDGSITASTLASNTITAAKIATDAIGANQIAADAIGASEIAADAIGSSEIAADAIGASEIAANAITTAELADGTITANKIAANAITSTQIADNAITANKLASNAITSAKIATDAITAAQIAAGAIGTSEVSTAILGASFNTSTDSLEALRDRMDISPAVGTAGGGTLSARIADSSLSPKKRLEIVGGEQKTITLITEANGRFNDATPTDITVKIKDANGTTITKNNASVTRVTEEADIQVDRITLTPSETTSLKAGYVTVEINVDGQKAILTTSLFIISGL